MAIWRIKCTSCGKIREIDLGYNLFEFKKIFLYCPYCKKNTFNEVIEAIEEAQFPQSSS